MINYIDNHTDNQKSYKNILAYIIKKRKTTRREIQRDTNYSWSSVSSVVSVLINKKHVIETDSVNIGVGRGTSYIIPNGDKLVSIGVDINSIGFTLSVIGIDGTKKYFAMRPYVYNSIQHVLDLVYELIDDGIKFIGDRYELVSIGLSCQGVVDLTHTYFERYSFCDGLSHLNLKQIIEDKYGVHTFVEHDTNCLLEDYRYSYGQKKSICIARVVSGIGFAICVNGQSLEKFGAIDFGHYVVQPKDGAICSCGRKGCLEAYASTEGIIKRLGLDHFSIVDQDREKYREVLNDAAFYLGVTFANVIKVFSLEEVIITGNVIGDDEQFLSKINETCREFETEKPAIITYIKDLSASSGAAILSLIDKVEGGNGL